jgi:hypothetical protein
MGRLLVGGISIARRSYPITPIAQRYCTLTPAMCRSPVNGNMKLYSLSYGVILQDNWKIAGQWGLWGKIVGQWEDCWSVSFMG